MLEHPQFAVRLARLPLRIIALAGLGCAAAALPAALSTSAVVSYRALWPSLKAFDKLSALRPPVSLPTGTELAPLNK